MCPNQMIRSGPWSSGCISPKSKFLIIPPVSFFFPLIFLPWGFPTQTLRNHSWAVPEPRLISCPTSTSSPTLFSTWGKWTFEMKCIFRMNCIVSQPDTAGCRTLLPSGSKGAVFPGGRSRLSSWTCRNPLKPRLQCHSKHLGMHQEKELGGPTASVPTGLENNQYGRSYYEKEFSWRDLSSTSYFISCSLPCFG